MIWEEGRDKAGRDRAIIMPNIALSLAAIDFANKNRDILLFLVFSYNFTYQNLSRHNLEIR
jgi:hypothetical protein